MARSAGSSQAAEDSVLAKRALVLCLGNEILADDAFGYRVADNLRRDPPRESETVSCSESGFRLLDHILGVDRLAVVDTVLTGSGPPGTIYALREEELTAAPGHSPHSIGLLDVLALARELDLPAPREVYIVAVEAKDVFTVGGVMDPGVESAISSVADKVRTWLAQTCRPD